MQWFYQHEENDLAEIVNLPYFQYIQKPLGLRGFWFLHVNIKSVNTEYRLPIPGIVKRNNMDNQLIVIFFILDYVCYKKRMTEEVDISLY